MRESVGDAFSRPVRNLLTNPSCETGGTVYAMWRNLINNPSAETVATGTTTLRTNLARNPTPGSADLTGWSTPTANLSGSRVTTGGPSGGSAAFYRATVTGTISVSPANVTVTQPGSNGIPVIPGQNYTFSAYTRTSFAISNIRIDVVWYNSSGTAMFTDGGAVVAFQTNAWERKRITKTAPANAAYAYVILAFSGPQSSPVGTTFDVSSVLVEQTDQLRPYFDGSTLDALGWDYGWSGTAWASTSTAKAGSVTVKTNALTNPGGERVATGSTTFRTNLATNPYLATTTTTASTGSAWGVYSPGVTGATSARQVGVFGPVSSYYRLVLTTVTDGTQPVYVTAAGSGTTAIQVVPGSPYTASLYGRVSWATNTQVLIEWYTSAGAWLAASGGSNLAHAANMVERRSVTAVAPATAAYARVSFLRPSNSGNAPTSGATMEASALLFEQTDQLREYFSGDTADAMGWDYGWSGSANLSTSTAKSAITTVRTNLVLNPSAEVDTAGYWSAWAEVPTQVAGGRSGTGFAARITATFDSTGIYVEYGGAAGSTNVRIPVVPGTTYTASYYARFSRAQATAGIIVRYYDAAGVQLDSNVRTGDVAVSANTWTRWSATTVAPANAVRARLVLQTGSDSNTVSGDTIDMDDLLFEASPSLSTYFDGSTGAAGDFAYAWSGTVGASTSIQIAPTPPGAATSGWFGYWPLRNARYTSLTASPSGNCVATFNYLAGGNTGVTVMDALSVPAGTVFNGGIKVKGPAGRTVAVAYRMINTSGGTAESMNIVTTTLDGTWQTITLAPWVTDIDRISVGIQAVQNTTNMAFGDVIYYDDAWCVTGHGGTNFTGDTPPTGDYRYVWSGTPHASASYQQAPLVAGWGAPNGAVVFQSLERAANGSASAEVIMPTSAGAIFTGTQIRTLLVGTDITANATYTFRAKVYSPTGSPDLRLSLQGSGLASSGSAAITSTKNSWVELSQAFTAGTSGTISAYVLNNVAIATGGLPVWVDSAMIVDGTYLSTQPYFDGDTPWADSDLTTVWTGLVHASITEVRATTINGQRDYGTRKSFQSSQWASSGTKSIRIPAQYAGNNGTDTFCSFGVGIEPPKPNTTYTILGKIRLTAMQVSPSNAYRAFVVNVNGTNCPITYTSTAPNVVGVSEVRGTFVTPGNATGWSFIRVMNGATNTDVWWDDLMLVEGVYDGPYIDGTSYDCVWVGTAHDSQSKGYPPSPLLMRNLITRPNMQGWSVGGSSWFSPGASTLVSLSTEWGVGSSTCLAVAGAGSGTDTFAMLGNYQTDIFNLKPNTTYTLSAWGKVTTPSATEVGGGNGYRQVSIWIYTASTYNIHRGNRLTNVAGGPPERSVVTFTTPATINHSFVRLYHGHSDGRTLWDGVMLTEGSTVHDYSDGDTPGWRWEGPANISPSVGYPYALTPTV